ncbi:hypothetical protein DCAR_0935630 [Daucus carota subsp. sativus]|uniref:Uncharacterized protein n=1 Tax=Daucus carota subsp. sativus TaxID=79200 RepID=A0A175YIX0_DAUCS|nr:hypothetical protein DCAR_0935630 [Daucus carota subsp. sativus]
MGLLDLRYEGIGGARIKCIEGHHNPNHIVQLGAPVNNTCETHKNIVVFLKVGGARAPWCPNVAPPLYEGDKVKQMLV